MKEDANEMKSNGALTKEPSESGAHYNIFDANYGAWLTSIGQERPSSPTRTSPITGTR